MVRLTCLRGLADQASLWEAFTRSKWEAAPKGQGKLSGLGKRKKEGDAAQLPSKEGLAARLVQAPMEESAVSELDLHLFISPKKTATLNTQNTNRKGLKHTKYLLFHKAA